MMVTKGDSIGHPLIYNTDDIEDIEIIWLIEISAFEGIKMISSCNSKYENNILFFDIIAENYLILWWHCYDFLL